MSVLLPAFNAASTLAACLHSITRQTERRWECVVVDDGSDDDTARLAAASAARDPRIVVVPAACAAGHEGLVAALNRGRQHCTAPLVARMDADDLMHRDRLRAQVAWLRAHRELAAVGCHVRLFPRSGLSNGLRRYERWLNSIDSPRRLRQEAYVECPVAHPSLVIRREVLAALGYRDAGWPEDYDLVLRLLAADHAVGVVPRRLLFWRDRPGRLWRTDSRYALDRFTACKAFFVARTFLAHAENYVLWGYGATGRSLRQALLEHGKQPSHIVELHPGRLGQRIHDAPVIVPDALRSLRGRPVVVSVAGEQARQQIRGSLCAMGFQELDDFICCA